MLSIFSCACWPSVCLFWGNAYLDLPPIFRLGCLFFWQRAAWPKQLIKATFSSPWMAFSEGNFGKYCFLPLITLAEILISFKCKWPDDPVFFSCLSLLVCKMGLTLPPPRHHCDRKLKEANGQSCHSTLSTVETPSPKAYFTRRPRLTVCKSESNFKPHEIKT